MVTKEKYCPTSIFDSSVAKSAEKLVVVVIIIPALVWVTGEEKD
jgi:hypothetical protein